MRWLFTIPVLAILAAVPCMGGVTGIISGRVVDINTHAPLAGANIKVVGTSYSTVTDKNGFYVLTEIPPGSYAVTTSMVGYLEGKVAELAVVMDHTVSADFSLEPTTLKVKGAEATVTGSRARVRNDHPQTAYVVSSKEEQLTRGQPNDLYQFPGIVFGQPGAIPDNTGYPHIRGGRADQVGYMLEGIPIVDSSDNNFATNIVSVGLDRLELLTGGYPALYGGFVGGVVNQVVKRGDQVLGGAVEQSYGSPWHYRNFIFENGNVIGKFDYYLSTIRWASDFPENNFTSRAPESNDNIFKLIYPLGAKDKLTMLANHGKARYDFVFQHDRTYDPATGGWVPTKPGIDNAGQRYDLDAIAWSHQLGPGSSGTLRFYRLSNGIQINMGSEVQNFWQLRKNTAYGAQLDLTHQLGSRHLLRAGAWYITGDNNVHPAVDYGLPFLFDYLANNDTRNLQLYAQDSWKANSRLTFDLGIRYDRMGYSRPSYPSLSIGRTSPRLGASYLLDRRTALRGTWGKYVQMPPSHRTGLVFLNPFWENFFQGRSDLGPQVDTGMDLGVEHKLTADTMLTATFFQRTSKGMTQRWMGDSDSFFDVENGLVRFASNGRGKASGMELKLDRRMSHNLRGWLSYTYAKARATSPAVNAFPFGSPAGFDTGTGRMYYVDWDQRHTLAMVLSYRMGRLELNPWLAVGSGYLYGQSGADLGGNDYAHGINPTFTYNGQEIPRGTWTDVPIVGNESSSPNSLRSRPHATMTLNLNYHLTGDRSLFVSLFNLLRSHQATNLVWYDDRTQAVLGYNQPDADHPHGYIKYVPYTTTPPFFVAAGVRQSF